MQKIFLNVLLLLLSVTALGQQDPLQSQYLFNPFIINPAYAGYSKDLNALAAYRIQWVGYDGGPVTMNASGHIALKDNRMGLGLIVLKDKIGADATTQVLASYAYHMQVTKNGQLSFGMRGGLINYCHDYNSLLIDDSDPKFQGNLNELRPGIGAGVIYSSDRLYAGLSVPNMLKTSTTVNGSPVVLHNQHAYMHLSYLFTLSDRLRLKPFLLARAVAASPANFDIGSALSVDDSYTLGIFSRSLSAYGFYAKMHVGEVLRLGYVFEMPGNKSVGIAYPSHEFTLAIRMKLLKFHNVLAVSDF